MWSRVEVRDGLASIPKPSTVLVVETNRNKQQTAAIGVFSRLLITAVSIDKRRAKVSYGSAHINSIDSIASLMYHGDRKVVSENGNTSFTSSTVSSTGQMVYSSVIVTIEFSVEYGDIVYTASGIKS
jgi:hypothetical protein